METLCPKWPFCHVADFTWEKCCFLFPICPPMFCCCLSYPQQSKHPNIEWSGEGCRVPFLRTGSQEGLFVVPLEAVTWELFFMFTSLSLVAEMSLCYWTFSLCGFVAFYFLATCKSVLRLCQQVCFTVILTFF